MATLGKKHSSLQGVWLGCWVEEGGGRYLLGFLNYFTVVQFPSTAEESRWEEGSEEEEGMCAWMINSPELYMGDKYRSWITGMGRALM